MTNNFSMKYAKKKKKFGNKYDFSHERVRRQKICLISQLTKLIGISR